MNEDIIHTQFTDFYIQLKIRYDSKGRRLPNNQYFLYCEWIKNNLPEGSYSFLPSSTSIHLISKEDLSAFTLRFGQVYTILEKSPQTHSKVDELLIRENLKELYGHDN